MKGLAFFESNPYPHAHLIVTLPRGASPLHFLINAKFWFAPQNEPSLRRVYPRAVTYRGRMLVQAIQPEELAQVVAYDTKEMEFRLSAVEDWKFLDDLSGS